MSVEGPVMQMTSDNSTAVPPIDSASLLDRCMGDPGLVCLLLGKCADQLSGLMSQLDAAAACGDFAAVSRVAHSLKGAAGNLSAVEVAVGAKKLEDAARLHSIESVRSVIAQLHEQVTRCSAFVPGLVARLRGESAVGVG